MPNTGIKVPSGFKAASSISINKTFLWHVVDFMRAVINTLSKTWTLCCSFIC